MTSITEQRRALQAEVKAVALRRGLSSTELAGRVGVSDRTVRRLLEGRAVALDTLERVARALGVRTRNPKVSQSITPAGVVSGWSMAAAVLGVDRRTVWLARRRADDRSPAVWATRDALLAWWVALLSRRAEVVSRRDSGQEGPGRATATTAGAGSSCAGGDFSQGR